MKRIRMILKQLKYLKLKSPRTNRKLKVISLKL